MINLDDVPKSTLQKVLLRGSIQMIKSLIMSNPRLFGATFLNALASAVRPQTLQTLIEQVNRGTLLTPEQIESAHQELEKLLREEQVVT